jgi:hypothetical protein
VNMDTIAKLKAHAVRIIGRPLAARYAQNSADIAKVRPAGFPHSWETYAEVARQLREEQEREEPK